MKKEKLKNERTKDVGAWENWSYALSGFGVNALFGMQMMYLLIYFTDVFGISAATAGIIFLIARVWDAVNDPIMGTIVDKTKTKWGKCRPYMIFGSIALAISFVLMFSGPTSLGPTGKVIYAGVTYILFGMMFTMVDIPANAIISRMTQNPQERANVTTFRRVIANVGMLLGVGAIGFVPLLGRGNDSRGYALTAIVIGVISSLLILTAGISTKERVKSEQKHDFSTKDLFKTIRVNTPLMILVSVFLVNQLAMSIKTATTAYYFTYNIGREDLTAIVGVISLLATILGTAIIPLLLKKFGKIKSIVIGLFIIAISSVGLYFTSYANITMIMVWFIINSLAAAFGLGLPYIMIIDTVEYGEWKTGKRTEGLVFSMLTFSMKLASAMGGAILGFLLTYTGYVPNTEQTPLALKGILVSITVIPVIVAIIGIILMKFYKLDEKMYQMIINELEKRKKSEEIC
ncbi:MAG: MFS transporter [Clostridiales bacterium]|nr:MFS transporter [Clostridiales bacterium]